MVGVGVEGRRVLWGCSSAGARCWRLALGLMAAGRQVLDLCASGKGTGRGRPARQARLGYFCWAAHYLFCVARWISVSWSFVFSLTSMIISCPNRMGDLFGQGVPRNIYCKYSHDAFHKYRIWCSMSSLSYKFSVVWFSNHACSILGVFRTLLAVCEVSC